MSQTQLEPQPPVDRSKKLSVADQYELREIARRAKGLHIKTLTLMKRLDIPFGE